jgi:hypothetical protein
MKRNAALVVALIGLVAVMALRANVTAQDDAVPVLQTQVADLETRVAVLEGSAGTPTTGEPGSVYSLSGRSFGITDRVVLGSMPYRASFTCIGNPLGFATMYDNIGIAEVINDGEMIMQNKAGTYWFDITCDKAWTLTISLLK